MPGAGQNRTGRSADDIILQVPVSTQILDEHKEVEIAGLTTEGDMVLLAQGGKGGLGNTNFKSSRIQAVPTTAQLMDTVKLLCARIVFVHLS